MVAERSQMRGVRCLGALEKYEEGLGDRMHGLAQEGVRPQSGRGLLTAMTGHPGLAIEVSWKAEIREGMVGRVRGAFLSAGMS